ncbi:MAG: alpha/beta fold hydrolase [Actinobacteria bacterium]|nr:alpha/beta fold hydrolase [Actinomycetota bacterium]
MGAAGQVTCPGGPVRIDDTSLWVVPRGPGDGYPLMVLHGGPGLDHHEFADYLDPLADDGIRLLLVDLRANGRSEKPPAHTWTLERMAQDVIMLARALDLERYAVLGHSFGALVALQNAVDYPGMAAQAIVSGGVPSMRWLAQAVESNLAAFEPEDLRRQVIASWERELSVETPEGFRELWRDQLPFHFADPFDPRIQEYLSLTKDTVYAPEILRAFAASSYGGIEVEDRLAEIRSPVLVLAGRHDRTCPPEAAVAMAEAMPLGELVVFERSGHMTFVEETEAYLGAVRSFLQRSSLR